MLANMYNLDKTDKQLIKLLEENAWQTSEAIARQLKVSSATVRRRQKQLVQNGVIRAVAITNPDRTNAGLCAIIALSVSHQDIDDVMQTLASQPEAKWVASTTGQFDILTLVEFNSTEELFQYVRSKLTQIEGIKDSETFVCLHVEKGKQLLGIS